MNLLFFPTFLPISIELLFWKILLLSCGMKECLSYMICRSAWLKVCFIPTFDEKICTDFLVKGASWLDVALLCQSL